MAAFTRVIARSVERSSDMHFTLIAGMVVAAVGLATLFGQAVVMYDGTRVVGSATIDATERDT